LLKSSLGVFFSTCHLLCLAALGDRFAMGRSRPSSKGSLAPTRSLAIATGLLLGINLLNRGNYALLAPAFALWLAWRVWREGGARRPGPQGFTLGVNNVPVAFYFGWFSNKSLHLYIAFI
jgi:hypothetical protein